MSSLNASIDPGYAKTITTRVQPYLYPYDPLAVTVGLASVDLDDDTTIKSTDSAALRRLAAALIEAADKADVVTAEHALIVGATQASA